VWDLDEERRRDVAWVYSRDEIAISISDISASGFGEDEEEGAKDFMPVKVVQIDLSSTSDIAFFTRAFAM